jgi:hypothetical protein
VATEMVLENARRAVVQAIEAAFPAVPSPRPEDVQSDHCPECTETAARFAGRTWPEIKASDLAGNPSPSLLTPRAFHYYLPALMLQCLKARRELDCLPMSLVSALSPAGGKPSAHVRAKLSGFTADQVGAILSFLRHFEATEMEEGLEDRSRRRVLARALRYWSALAGEAA